MPALSQAQRRGIEQIVTPARVRFDERERRVYSHDTAVLPALLGAFAGRCLADGVVQPQTEDELRHVVRFANEHGIPVVPRGKGTAGYGGVVPTRGGLVLDLSRLRGPLRVDRERMTVTVGAASVWSDLEAELAGYGLATRLHPTSAPSSTVGGWLAQGGAGIGSHQFGWFSQNVRSARMVTALGDVRGLDRNEVMEVADAEGTTGIITEISLDVQPLTELEQCAVAFSDAGSLASALAAIGQKNPPIWSLTFATPELARLKNTLAESGVGLPADAYSMLAAYRFDDSAEVLATLRAIAEELGGRRLPVAVARHEWAERFRPMRLKRLGPSLVPVEVVVPTGSVGEVLRDLERRIKAPLPLEGVSVCGDEIVLLGLVPHDERKLGFSAGFGVVVSAIRTAERYGGRPYSTGRYFGHRAERVLGSDRLAALENAKRLNDPRGILNPGKVIFDTGTIDRLIRVAAGCEAAVRLAANSVGGPRLVAEEREADSATLKKRLASHVVRHAYACAQCGYCIESCPQFQADSWESSSPRGKWSLLKDVLNGRDRIDNRMIDLFSACTACGKCDTACQLDLPILASWGSVRAAMFEGMLTRSS